MNQSRKNFIRCREDAIVKSLVTRWPAVVPPVVVGPGDDCAVLSTSEGWQLLKTDAMVEGYHFSSEENMQRVGWKAIARVQSDFAAMGGYAEAFVVSLFLPEDGDLTKWHELYVGMAMAAQANGGVLCGGETSRSPSGAGLILSIAGTGRCDAAPVLRSGAKPGDLICVTGELGGSIVAHHLDFSPRVKEGMWLAKCGMVSAMMDLSDGLAADLPRLCAMSKIGAIVDELCLPIRQGFSAHHALSDGEDYELLFTISPVDRSAFETAWCRDFPPVKISVIGKCVEEGRGMEFQGGWDPFRYDE